MLFVKLSRFIPPVIASFVPQLRKRIQSLVSGILDLKFDLEFVHARQERSLADFPQYNGPVNFDFLVSRLISLSPLP
jgi:hypothetical protein